MKKIKHMLIIFLVTAVLVPSSVFASSDDDANMEAETETSIETEAESEVKTEAETETETETAAELRSVTAVTSDYYTDITEYAAALKSKLKAREETVVLYYVGQNKDDKPSDAYQLATAHTGNGAEGDYLLHNIKNYSAKITSYGEFKEGYLFKYEWTITYFTTSKQEEYVSSQCSSIMSGLSLSGKSDYQKVKAIHDYMTKNFSQANTSSTTYEERCTAYALLKNKSGNCKAFATLFYRLCLSAGVDARYVGGGGHAWNIVRVDGTYYCIDVMWDTVAENYFLKGTTEFMTNHTAASSSCFYSYNVSSSDYVTESSTEEDASNKTSESSTKSGSDTSKKASTAADTDETTSETDTNETTSEAADTEENDDTDTETEEENAGNGDTDIQKLHKTYLDISVAQNMMLARYGKARLEKITCLIENFPYHILLSPFPSGISSVNK